MSAADIYIISYAHFQTEAGCRVLINIILLRLASTIQTDKSEVNIIPEFPIPKTIFQIASGWVIVLGKVAGQIDPTSTIVVQKS